MQQKKLEILKKQVHEVFDDSVYNSTNVRENTNCYSDALGAKYPELQIYRIGLFCGKKPDIKEPYKSFEEIKELLFEDLQALELQYDLLDKCMSYDGLKDNQNIIRLYISKYSNGKLGYHFIRYKNGKWTEKLRGQYQSELYTEYGIKYDLDTIWNYGCTLKITR